MKTYKLGILGCGDFLRWQEPSIKNSPDISVSLLFDPDREKAEKFAKRLGGRAAANEDEVFTDPEIDIVCIFVPPWLRMNMIKKAVENGKHIISTKPLAPTPEEAEEMIQTVGSRVKCGIIYNRTENAAIETAKEMFTNGGIGRMALYKQDWIHHYPAWNNWALDPEKNGGPFMDAMIHNLNIARYLAGGEIVSHSFFSDNLSHPELKCTDTDFMKLDFSGNCTAYLFITWAADLAVYSTAGNDREHIDINYMISSEGWRITEENRDGKKAFVASKNGEEKIFPVDLKLAPIYQRYAEALENSAPLPQDIVQLPEAAEDIRLITRSRESCCV